MITSVFVSVPLATKSHRGNRMGEGKWLHTQWVVVQKRDSELKDLTYFIKTTHRLVIAIEGDTISIFQEVKQTFPFSQRYALPIASKQIYCVHTLTVCASDCKMCRNERKKENYGELSYNPEFYECRCKGLTFEPAGHWIEIEEISRKRFGWVIDNQQFWYLREWCPRILSERAECITAWTALWEYVTLQTIASIPYPLSSLIKFDTGIYHLIFSFNYNLLILSPFSESVSHSVLSDSLQPLLDCSLPGSSLPWYFPGKDTGMGCHCLLQGIFFIFNLSCSQHHWISIISFVDIYLVFPALFIMIVCKLLE